MRLSHSRRRKSRPQLPKRATSPFEETIKPTWETQKQARTYVLDIPAPRGQITDRNGSPLAQNRLSYNLTIDFPTPLDLSDAQALAFARQRIRAAEKMLGRSLDFPATPSSGIITTADSCLFEIAQNLSEPELGELKDNLPAGLSLKPIYQRFYPNKSVAGADHRLYRADESERRRHHRERPGALAGDRGPGGAGADL